MSGDALGIEIDMERVVDPTFVGDVGIEHGGELLAFTNLVHGDTNGQNDIFVVDLSNLSAVRATMAMIGDECGPCRLPLATLDEGARELLRADLQRIGFFDWARTPAASDA